MLSWSPTVFGSCRSVFRPYLARLKSKRRTVRTSGIRTTRRTFLDRNKSRQLGKVSLFRCSVEFGGIAGWNWEVKIRKPSWSDQLF
ncbi:hypothetical protein LINPERPRIM_LOCUS38970 [Linum perenne]